MEGHWKNKTDGEGEPLILFSWLDMEREETRFAVEIPRLESVILIHSWDGQIPTLKIFPREMQPFLFTLMLVFLGYSGLGISFYSTLHFRLRCSLAAAKPKASVFSVSGSKRI